MAQCCSPSSLYRIPLLLATIILSSMVASDSQDASSISASGSSEAQRLLSQTQPQVVPFSTDLKQSQNEHLLQQPQQQQSGILTPSDNINEGDSRNKANTKSRDISTQDQHHSLFDSHSVNAFDSNYKNDASISVTSRAIAPKFLGKKSDDGGILLATRGSPRFVGKRNRDKSLAGISLESRGSPRFVGKRRNGKIEDMSDRFRAILRANRGSPRFVGKRRGDYMDFNTEQNDILVAARGSPRFVGKRYLNDDDGDFSYEHFLEERGSPMFLGKKESKGEMDKLAVNTRGKPIFVGRSVNMNRESRARSPKFFGKKRALSNSDDAGEESSDAHKIAKRAAEEVDVSATDISSGRNHVSKRGFQQYSQRGVPFFIGKRNAHKIAKRAAEEVDVAATDSSSSPNHVAKRHAPRFVGKRGYRYSQRGAPFFIGKRHIRMSSSGSKAPFLSAQEYKETFRRSDPYFIGKREDDYDFERSDQDETLFSTERRAAPKFIGKRWPPKFVGRRGAPKFIGRRGSPLFIGKRDLSFDDGFYESDDNDFDLKRHAPKFVGRRSEYGVDDSLYLGSRDVEERNLAEFLEASSLLEAALIQQNKLRENKRAPIIIGRRNAEEFPSGVFSAGDDERKRR